MRPWFGLHVPLYTFPDTPPERIFDRVVEQAQAAESAGFNLVTVMDHLYQIAGVGADTEPMLEGWSTLNALARETSRVRLGRLVTGVTYRHPALLAKMATTLDVISGGRAIFGLGAAWNEAEHIGYGYDFPSVGERMDRLDEALSIARAMFTEDRPTFAGRHYRIDRALNVPKPIQPGGLPILIGGGGEQRTLRIAAKHADMTHWFPLGFDALRHRTEVLEGWCESIGRDPATIERTRRLRPSASCSESSGAEARRRASASDAPESASPGRARQLAASDASNCAQCSVARPIRVEILRLVQVTAPWQARTQAREPCRPGNRRFLRFAKAVWADGARGAELLASDAGPRSFPASRARN
ncbi:MAG TPA: TIGR03560 family F420-dependent LLM class oxidoreductase [Candidatus Eisenbacteria bacterium]|nr:TIGR03560 family F420-dependent LLM class oxidoreductase [Candidatus Eisenbacteria bacterium]